MMQKDLLQHMYAARNVWDLGLDHMRQVWLDMVSADRQRSIVLPMAPYTDSAMSQWRHSIEICSAEHAQTGIEVVVVS